jgi:hypothetical protein
MWQQIYFKMEWHGEYGGYTYTGALGIFDSYVSAIAAQSGYWDEYCEYHRTKRVLNANRK